MKKLPIPRVGEPDFDAAIKIEHSLEMVESMLATQERKSRRHFWWLVFLTLDIAAVWLYVSPQ